MTLNRNRVLIAAGLLATSFAFPVLADPPADGVPGGPPVGEKSQRGRDGFGKEGKDGQRAGATERRNPEVWRKAYESVASTMTDEQKTQTEALRADFESKVKAWKDANGAKEKELQDKFRAAREENAKKQQGGEGQDGKGRDPNSDKTGKDAPTRGKGAPGDKGQRTPPVDPALMKEMQALKATMPKPEELHNKMWAVLTPDQQATFKENYDKFQKEFDANKPQRRKGPEGGDGMGEGDGNKPPRRPDQKGGRPFQFDDNNDGGGKGKNNGDGKPSGK